MNEQHAPGGIEWTRLRESDGTQRRGFTWNVIAGCIHACRWAMPDGSEAECYAKTIAERLAKDSYPHGFAHHYWHPERLAEPLKVKTPAGIFLDSQADLFAHNVPPEQIEAVLDMVRQAHWHTFFVLTKNAPRLLQFKDKLPSNLWVGVSMPPSNFMGRPLSEDQQRRYINRALDVLDQLPSPVRWMSLEPLSFNIFSVLAEWMKAHGDGIKLPLEWVVIGAASNGPQTFQPEKRWVDSLLMLFDSLGTPIFFKGNLAWNIAEWREDFPAWPPKARAVDMRKLHYDVRIDRATEWGNPFKIGQDGDREQVIAKYEAYFRGRLDLVGRLPELRRKRLGCWCSPLACHGDVLARLAEMSEEELEAWLGQPMVEQAPLHQLSMF